MHVERYNDPTGDRMHWQEAITDCDEFLFDRPGHLGGFLIGGEKYLVLSSSLDVVRASKVSSGTKIGTRSNKKSLIRLRKMARSNV